MCRSEKNENESELRQKHPPLGIIFGILKIED